MLGDAGSPRSYMVQIDDGIYRRNRQHLLKVPHPTESTELQIQEQGPTVVTLLDEKQLEDPKSPCAVKPTSPETVSTSEIPKEPDDRPGRTRSGRAVIAPKRLDL